MPGIWNAITASLRQGASIAAAVAHNSPAPARMTAIYAIVFPLVLWAVYKVAGKVSK